MGTLRQRSGRYGTGFFRPGKGLSAALLCGDRADRGPRPLQILLCLYSIFIIDYAHFCNNQPQMQFAFINAICYNFIGKLH